MSNLRGAVQEEQLRERLLRVGKTDAEIEHLIDQYTEAASSNELLDRDVISELLKKSKKDSILRVTGFKLTREQYDSLLNYFEKSEAGVPNQEVSANLLVQKALDEFINMLS